MTVESSAQPDDTDRLRLLGQLIRDRREALGLTMRQVVAADPGPTKPISRSSWSQVENGKNAGKSFGDTYRNIEHVLGLAPGSVLAFARGTADHLPTVDDDLDARIVSPPTGADLETFRGRRDVIAWGARHVLDRMSDKDQEEFARKILAIVAEQEARGAGQA